jgi:hypothetical protein
LHQREARADRRRGNIRTRFGHRASIGKGECTTGSAGAVSLREMKLTQNTRCRLVCQGKLEFLDKITAFAYTNRDTRSG